MPRTSIETYIKNHPGLTKFASAISKMEGKHFLEKLYEFCQPYNKPPAKALNALKKHIPQYMNAIKIIDELDLDDEQIAAVDEVIHDNLNEKHRHINHLLQWVYPFLTAVQKIKTRSKEYQSFRSNNPPLELYSSSVQRLILLNATNKGRKKKTNTPPPPPKPHKIDHVGPKKLDEFDEIDHLIIKTAAKSNMPPPKGNYEKHYQTVKINNELCVKHVILIRPPAGSEDEQVKFGIKVFERLINDYVALPLCAPSKNIVLIKLPPSQFQKYQGNKSQTFEKLNKFTQRDGTVIGSIIPKDLPMGTVAVRAGTASHLQVYCRTHFPQITAQAQKEIANQENNNAQVDTEEEHLEIPASPTTPVRLSRLRRHSSRDSENDESSSDEALFRRSQQDALTPTSSSTQNIFRRLSSRSSLLIDDLNNSVPYTPSTSNAFSSATSSTNDLQYLLQQASLKEKQLLELKNEKRRREHFWEEKDTRKKQRYAELLEQRDQLLQEIMQAEQDAAKLIPDFANKMRK